MPSNFRCTGCSIRFTVGWYHYHDPGTGYGAMARLVCKSCGTEHAVEIAARDRGPERIGTFDVSLTRLAEGKRVEAMKILRSRFDMTPEESKSALDSFPLEIGRRIHRQLVDELVRLFSPVAAVAITEIDSEPNPRYGPPMPDRFLSGRAPRFSDDEHLELEELATLGIVTGPNNEFLLDQQSCRHCSAVGTLSGEPETVSTRCPHCGQTSIECVESWTT